MNRPGAYPGAFIPRYSLTDDTGDLSFERPLSHHLEHKLAAGLFLINVHM